MRPFGGLRGARIDQSLTNSFRGSDQSFARKRNKEKFTGVGPLIGLEANVNILCGFSIYGSASVSWLYGNFNNRLSDFNSTVDTVSSCKTRKRLDANLAAADAALGIRWKTCLCNMKLILQLGLEHHRYFGYKQCNHGDLSFDGVNFGAGIEF